MSEEYNFFINSYRILTNLTKYIILIAYIQLKVAEDLKNGQKWGEKGQNLKIHKEKPFFAYFFMIPTILTNYII